MKNRRISKIIATSSLIVASVFILSGCGSGGDKNQKNTVQKNNSETETKTSNEDLKKPIVQEDIDKELKSMDEDLNNISSNDLNENDLNEKSL